MREKIIIILRRYKIDRCFEENKAANEISSLIKWHEEKQNEVFEKEINPLCRLGRFSADCTIIKNTSFKEYSGCGHYKNKK